ncbi:M48 metallopeptidase family protein [Zhihengliuella flava]|uniref:Metal-dependent hydrolase n=1 Tax=Zhihengliuella flava TaxID=1285193 RepID=A0A931DF13_9MICC|nr:M48 family metallopeptidase [Zhihengliuella flava]MBG6085583.1 putative metal-dependent hydrolase [Zhihengliuella flava]
MAQRTVREYQHQDGTTVRIVVSTRRTKTVGGKWDGDAVVITVPAWMDRSGQDRHAQSLVTKMTARRHRQRARSDKDLLERARALDEQYLEGRAQPEAVRWVTNQNTRWASATRGDQSIRLSHRLQRMPDWVQDSVLVHELAHLIATDGHGPIFTSWANRYPRMAEADAYLEGVAFAWQNPQDA